MRQRLNYIVYSKEAKDWELKQRTDIIKKKNQIDIPDAHIIITQTTISVYGPNSKLNLDEKIVSRR